MKGIEQFLYPFICSILGLLCVFKVPSFSNNSSELFSLIIELYFIVVLLLNLKYTHKGLLQYGFFGIYLPY